MYYTLHMSMGKRVRERQHYTLGGINGRNQAIALTENRPICGQGSKRVKAILRQPYSPSTWNSSKIGRMKAFHSGREAKEFLVSQIVEEAQRENIPLSEVERKMLYFTESGWTLPDIMKVSEDFDRENDQAEYERKIAKLVTKATGAFARVPVMITTDGGQQSIFFNEKITTFR